MNMDLRCSTILLAQFLQLACRCPHSTFARTGWPWVRLLCDVLELGVQGVDLSLVHCRLWDLLLPFSLEVARLCIRVMSQSLNLFFFLTMLIAWCSMSCDFLRVCASNCKRLSFAVCSCWCSKLFCCRLAANRSACALLDSRMSRSWASASFYRAWHCLSMVSCTSLSDVLLRQIHVQALVLFHWPLLISSRLLHCWVGPYAQVVLLLGQNGYLVLT